MTSLDLSSGAGSSLISPFVVVASLVERSSFSFLFPFQRGFTHCAWPFAQVHTQYTPLPNSNPPLGAAVTSALVALSATYECNDSGSVFIRGQGERSGGNCVLNFGRALQSLLLWSLREESVTRLGQF